MRTRCSSGASTARRAGLVASVLACALLAASPSGADSGIVLTYPRVLGRVSAATFDTSGIRTSDANLVVEPLAAGRIRMSLRYGNPAGAHTVASALFESVEPGRSVRLLEQESRSFDPEGNPLPVLRVDHVARLATCRSTEGVESLRLPEGDRVVNVPMNLFLLPLVRDQERSLSFHLFLCRNGARLMEFEAWAIVDASPEAPGLVEIRYGPQLGGLLSVLARSFAPRMSLWFDPAPPHAWAGHRLPLYAGGPEVIVVRDGIPSAALVD